MGFYGSGWVAKMFNIQEPFKAILRKMGLGVISLAEAEEIIKLLKAVSELPKIEREKVQDPNTAILIDVYAESKKHLTQGFLQSYEPIFDMAFNFGASKLDYDGFYKDFANWFLGEMFRRGWKLPAHNRPNSTLWDSIPLTTRTRLAQSIKDDYDLLQVRLETINSKLGKNDPEGNAQRASRFGQFVNRVLANVEREVVAWQ